MSTCSDRLTNSMPKARNVSSARSNCDTCTDGFDDSGHKRRARQAVASGYQKHKSC